MQYHTAQKEENEHKNRSTKQQQQREKNRNSMKNVHGLYSRIGNGIHLLIYISKKSEHDRIGQQRLKRVREARADSQIN